jgi:hypothetical protein
MFYGAKLFDGLGFPKKVNKWSLDTFLYDLEHHQKSTVFENVSKEFS